MIEPVGEQRRLRLAKLLQLLFVVGFSAELYVFSATASIYDTYQPGISTFRMRVNPLALLLVAGGVPLLAALTWRAQRTALAKFGTSISLFGGAICLAFLFVLFVLEVAGFRCDEPLPAIRELSATLGHSLRCPTFSGRSSAAPLYGVVLSALLFVSSRRVQRAK